MYNCLLPLVENKGQLSHLLLALFAHFVRFANILNQRCECGLRALLEEFDQRLLRGEKPFNDALWNV